MTSEAMHPDWIRPSFASLSAVHAVMTTRSGGCSPAPFDDGNGSGGMNLGTNCDDDPQCVQRNRERLGASVGVPVCWLSQRHGTSVAIVQSPAQVADWQAPPCDASVTTLPGVALAILTADCLPVLFAAPGVIGAAHAGWRGLADGVLEQTVDAMVALGARREEVVAWLGPAIGPCHFEVGADVGERFGPQGSTHFKPIPSVPGKWLADLPALARQRLAHCGIGQVGGGGQCTVDQPARFYSYRRDRRTGRMGALIWLSEA